MKINLDRKCYAQGFSLIELMLAVGVVAVLAALLFSSVGAYRRYADGLRCTSNLRTMMQAVLSYTVDHGGMLPGPLYGQQRAYTTPKDANSVEPPFLIARIAPYLGLQIPAGSATSPIIISDAFICPAGWRVIQKERPSIKYGDGIYYLTLGDPAATQPFGYIGNAPPHALPKRLTKIENPSKVYALVCTDYTFRPNAHAPSRPPHGLWRNVGFVDGHVESIPLEDFK